jgi:hypothetical protein
MDRRLFLKSAALLGLQASSVQTAKPGGAVVHYVDNPGEWWSASVAGPVQNAASAKGHASLIRLTGPERPKVHATKWSLSLLHKRKAHHDFKHDLRSKQAYPNGLDQQNPAWERKWKTHLHDLALRRTGRCLRF